MSVLTLISLLPVVGIVAVGGDDPNAPCPVFVLKVAGGSYAIDVEQLQAGQVKVFPSSRESGIIDVICPVGPGGSGSVVRLRDNGLLIARCSDGALQITSRATDGKEWERPARKLIDLARYDVRVNVSGADGSRRAFLIERNAEVTEESIGPVMDMFAGRIPMSEGDFALFTDTYRNDPGTKVFGESELTLDRWPIARVKLPGGCEADFIVDTGGGSTVVAKSFLTDGIAIEKSSMVQYSAAGRKLLKYTPGGATGQVQSIVGQATLPELRVGGIVFRDVTVDVMKDFPDMFGRPIKGILGLDLMRRCDVLSFDYSRGQGTKGGLAMRRANEPTEQNAVEIPFAFVKSHLMVKGKVNGAPVHFVLDSGAPRPFLDTAAAKRIGIQADTNTAKPGRGLDGGSAEVRTGAMGDLSFEDGPAWPVDFAVSPLAAFNTMRANGQNTGLLGNAFFRRFQRMEIDFTDRVVRLVP